MNPSLVIVIVSYNCREALRGCLESARGYHVIVVDNASGDGSAAMARAEFPEIRLIENEQNRGFAAACNQGIEASREPFILLLNPDTVINATALERLLEVMTAHPDIAACGPRILNLDGSPQPSCRSFPTLGALACDELGLSFLFPRIRWFAGYYRSAWPQEKTSEVDQLMGSCLLLRRSALDNVGLFDERFFMYFEEVDLCLRLKSARWRILYVYDVTIIHDGGQSSRTDWPGSLRHRYRSLFRYYAKHHPRWQLSLLRIVVQLGALLRALAGRRGYAQIAKEVWKL